MTEQKPSPLGPSANCPLGEQCEVCEATTLLAVDTVDSPVGVFCVTLCDDCAEAGKLPKIRSWSIAIERSADHCVHVGLTVDQAAAIIEAEKAER